MRNLPITNSKAVTAPPIHTSRQRIFTSGTYLNISANTSAMMAKEMTKFRICHSTSPPGSELLSAPPSADRPALNTSDIRSKKPITSTMPRKPARRVAARLSESFSGIDSVLSELKGDAGQVRLKVAMSSFILEYWLSERLPWFNRTAPEVELSFDLATGYVDLIAGDADMAIRFSPEPGPEFVFEPIYRGWFFPVCTPAFAEAHGLTPGTTDLTGIPLYRLHDATTDPAWCGWEAMIARHGLRKDDPGPVERITGLRTALSGAGLMIVGLTEAFHDLKERRLMAPLGPRFVFPFTYGYRLVWPAGRELTRPMRLFRTWMLAERDVYLEEASALLGREIR